MLQNLQLARITEVKREKNSHWGNPRYRVSYVCDGLAGDALTHCDAMWVYGPINWNTLTGKYVDMRVSGARRRTLREIQKVYS